MPKGVYPRTKPVIRRKVPIAERFWARVAIGPAVSVELGPCWLWTGGSNGHGYGQCHPRWQAHRLALTLMGWLPEGLLALHRCDVKRCVRPTHLYAGTPRQNSNDMYERNRHPRTGNPNPWTEQHHERTREFWTPERRLRWAEHGRLSAERRWRSN